LIETNKSIHQSYLTCMYGRNNFSNPVLLNLHNSAMNATVFSILREITCHTCPLGEYYDDQRLSHSLPVISWILPELNQQFLRDQILILYHWVKSRDPWSSANFNCLIYNYCPNYNYCRTYNCRITIFPNYYRFIDIKNIAHSSRQVLSACLLNYCRI